MTSPIKAFETEFGTVYEDERDAEDFHTPAPIDPAIRARVEAHYMQDRISGHDMWSSCDMCSEGSPF